MIGANDYVLQHTAGDWGERLCIAAQTAGDWDERLCIAVAGDWGE